MPAGLDQLALHWQRGSSRSDDLPFTFIDLQQGFSWQGMSRVHIGRVRHRRADLCVMRPTAPLRELLVDDEIGLRIERQHFFRRHDGIVLPVVPEFEAMEIEDFTFG